MSRVAFGGQRKLFGGKVRRNSGETRVWLRCDAGVKNGQRRQRPPELRKGHFQIQYSMKYTTEKQVLMDPITSTFLDEPV
eukprot:scaffold1307_cov200-Pinguiococcus_pyrenoidosus.AAC.120